VFSDDWQLCSGKCDDDADHNLGYVVEQLFCKLTRECDVQGEVSKPVTLRTLPASGLEGEERFQLQLVRVSNRAVISASDGSATVIIRSDPRLSGTVAVSPHSQAVVVGQLRDGYDGSGRVQLVRNGGKYGRVDVTWQILTSADSDVFLQTEGIATFHDLDTTADVYITVIMLDCQNTHEHTLF